MRGHILHCFALLGVHYLCFASLGVHYLEDWIGMVDICAKLEADTGVSIMVCPQ